MNRLIKPGKSLCQKSHFHSTSAHAIPRGTKADKPSKWGTFQRLAPASFAPINVRNMTRRPVPSHILLPPYAATGASSVWDPHVAVHSEADMLGMRKACQLAREVLELGSTLCKPHVTTNEIDAILHEAIIKKNAYPSPLNYMGFPKSICTSINNVIAHGIPDDRPLQDGDFINIDITVYLDGYHGDTSATFMVGDVDDRGKALVECTKETLDKAIAISGPNVPLKEVGRVICDIAEKNGYSVSDELSGHGIGKEFHCLPLVYHHRNQEEGVMTVGSTFTIEPILCQGSATGIMWPDQWTISTVDGGRSAQFEHTLLVTEDGVDILT